VQVEAANSIEQAAHASVRNLPDTRCAQIDPGRGSGDRRHSYLFGGRLRSSASHSQARTRVARLCARDPRLPDPAVPLLIARLRWRQQASPAAAEERLFSQVTRRRTHRGGFDPVPPDPGLVEALRQGRWILQDELARLQAAADEAAVQWDRCQAEADNWLLRAALLGGEHAIRLVIASDGQAADVRISYETTMGTRYPTDAACTISPAATWDSLVVARARQSHRTALAAAGQHAATAAAVRAAEAEVRATRYRLRAVQDRWIPVSSRRWQQ
jgi:vacuolar-type H+-ATPase subunit D/Vma8